MTTPPPNGDDQAKQIRDLAIQIAKLTKLGFDPMTIRKGIIGAVVDGTSPPTVSLNLSGDTDTLVTQVRTLNNYTPIVGQTVLIAKQGTEIFLLGAISAGDPYSVNTTTDNGWKRATLTNGSHGGNGNGDIYYRRVLDHGSWKMQWRGGWAPGGATTMIATANALDPMFRPSSKRSILAARQIQTGATALQFDFNTDGTVFLIGDTTAPTLNINNSAPGGSTDTSGSHSHGFNDTYGASGEFYASDTTFSAGSHSHSIFVNSHYHGGSISVTAPTWVSLNGLEYFL